MAEKKSLILDLCIPYCITPLKYTHKLQSTGSNYEKNAYIEAMMKEVISYQGELEDYEIQAIRLSGGAATVMNPDLLGSLLSIVRKTLPVAQHAEVSFDALPNTIGTPSLTGISAGHPTRAELMMHSESDDELRILNCPFVFQDVKNALLFFNKFNLNNISISVDYGFSGQTMASWKKTLGFCAKSMLAHITVIPAESTKKEELLSDEVRYDMYRFACMYLPSEGYIHYGHGLFCRPNHENRFLSLMNNGCEVLGIGAGAITCMDGYMVRNINNPVLYLQHAGDYEKTTAQAAVIDPDTAKRRYVYGRLCMVQGFSLEGYLSRFGEPVPKNIQIILTQLENDGLIEEKDGIIIPTLCGLYYTKKIESMFF